jgi:hemin uptake protein HemP
MHSDAATPAPDRPTPVCAARADALQAARPADTPTRRLSSAELLGSARELEISHGDALYRLRLTSLGKLILTK